MALPTRLYCILGSVCANSEQVKLIDTIITKYADIIYFCMAYLYYNWATMRKHAANIVIYVYIKGRCAKPRTHRHRNSHTKMNKNKMRTRTTQIAVSIEIEFKILFIRCYLQRQCLICQMCQSWQKKAFLFIDFSIEEKNTDKMRFFVCFRTFWGKKHIRKVQTHLDIV